MFLLWGGNEMEKYRKRILIEVVGITPEGYLVQNEGDSSDRWVIDPETFETSYEKLEEVTGCCEYGEVDNRPQDVLGDPQLLFEALRATNSNSCEDIDFRTKVKEKLELILGL